MANSDGPLVQIQQPLEKDDVKEQLLQRWNAMPDDATWADLATQELNDPAQKDSLRVELQRYAKRTEQFIRRGKSGSRKS